MKIFSKFTKITMKHQVTRTRSILTQVKSVEDASSMKLTWCSGIGKRSAAAVRSGIRPYKQSHVTPYMKTPAVLRFSSTLIRCHYYAAGPPSLVGRIKRSTPSVCLSVTCLRFSRKGKTLEKSNFVETWRWARITRGKNLKSKGQRSRSRSLRTKSLSSRISWSLKSGSI